jgi:hypothetical protein
MERPERATWPAGLRAERQGPAPRPLVNHVEEVKPGVSGGRGGSGGSAAAAGRDRRLGAGVGRPGGNGSPEGVVVTVLVGVLAVGAPGDGTGGGVAVPGSAGRALGETGGDRPEGNGVDGGARRVFEADTAAGRIVDEVDAGAWQIGVFEDEKESL